jgi:hypothetical protein
MGIESMPNDGILLEGFMNEYLKKVKDCPYLYFYRTGGPRWGKTKDK